MASFRREMQSCWLFWKERLVSIWSHFSHLIFTCSQVRSRCCYMSILITLVPHSGQLNFSLGQLFSIWSLSAFTENFWLEHLFGHYLSRLSHWFFKWLSKQSYFSSVWQPAPWFGHLNSSWFSIARYNLWIFPGWEVNGCWQLLSKHRLWHWPAHLKHMMYWHEEHSTGCTTKNLHMGHTKFWSISFSERIEVNWLAWREALTEFKPTLVRQSLSIGCASSILLQTLFWRLEVISCSWLLNVL